VRRRTKIIATIGPASDSEATLVALIEAGMDVARIGLAHGDLDHHLECYDRIRKASVEADRPVGILVDLPGPKVRAGSFPESGVELVEGERIRLTPGFSASTAEVVEVGYERLVSDVEVGDRMLFGDGAVVIEVVDKNDRDLIATVAHGGKVQGRPGVHIPSDRLRIASPTPDDLRMLDAFVERGVDMVAVSFVRSAHDIRRVGTEPHPRGPLVVAKIETRAAVQNLEGIIQASGAVMVARGDLGAEMPIAEIPHLQKHIIRTCIALGRPAITATQMLESMVHAGTPTRAEVTDVANAVFDGTSVVMLSGETAIGHDPVHTEEGDADARVTDTMTMAAWRVAKEMRADAILCMSRTGFTVRAMARFRPKTKILGFSPDERTVRQLTMSWGAQPMLLEQRGSNEAMVRAAVRAAREAGQVRSGDTVVVLAGSDDRSRATDVLRLVRVP
jgi:pyruvate kinase